MENNRNYFFLLEVITNAILISLFLTKRWFFTGWSYPSFMGAQ
jgi:hypothetical protein